MGQTIDRYIKYKRACPFVHEAKAIKDRRIVEGGMYGSSIRGYSVAQGPPLDEADRIKVSSTVLLALLIPLFTLDR